MRPGEVREWVDLGMYAAPHVRRVIRNIPAPQFKGLSGDIGGGIMVLGALGIGLPAALAYFGYKKYGALGVLGGAAAGYLAFKVVGERESLGDALKDLIR